MGDSPDVLSDAREWLRQRDTYRDQLREQLERAKARVAEIEGLLVELGEFPQHPPQAPAAAPASTVRTFRIPKRTTSLFDLKRGTTADVILAVLSDAPDGLRAGEILKGVLALRPHMKPPTVYPTIYRMRDDKRIGVRGGSGDSVYFLPPEDKDE